MQVCFCTIVIVCTGVVCSCSGISNSNVHGPSLWESCVRLSGWMGINGLALFMLENIGLFLKNRDVPEARPFLQSYYALLLILHRCTLIQVIGIVRMLSQQL